MEFVVSIAKSHFLPAVFVLVLVMGLSAYSIYREDTYKCRMRFTVLRYILLAVSGILLFSILSVKENLVEDNSAKETPLQDWGRVMIYDSQQEKYVIY